MIWAIGKWNAQFICTCTYSTKAFIHCLETSMKFYCSMCFLPKMGARQGGVLFSVLFTECELLRLHVL